MTWRRLNARHPISPSRVQDDSPELLASDVHTAGAGLCDDAAVMKLAIEGPHRVEQVLLRGTAEVCPEG